MPLADRTDPRDDASTGGLGPSGTLAILLAGGEGARLHELSAIESKPALPLSGRRLVDFACAAAARAGIGRLAVALGPRADTLARHLREVWGEAFDLTLRDAGLTTLESIARCRDGAADLLILPADQVHALDLGALLHAHRAAGAMATLAGEVGRPGPVVLRPEALSQNLDSDLWADLLPALAAQGELALWQPPADAYRRDVDTLDDLRLLSLDFRGGAPCALPRAAAAPLCPLDDEDGRALTFEVAGLRLSAPRLGARARGRWTLIEDSLVLPGARVAPGARLSRAVVAPGAVVPANLVVGEDPSEDARWFRVTPGGTTLLTAPMLAQRAADRMRQQLGARLPGFATPKAQG